MRLSLRDTLTSFIIRNLRETINNAVEIVAKLTGDPRPCLCPSILTGPDSLTNCNSETAGHKHSSNRYSFANPSNEYCGIFLSLAFANRNPTRWPKMMYVQHTPCGLNKQAPKGARVYPVTSLKIPTVASSHFPEAPEAGHPQVKSDGPD